MLFRSVGLVGYSPAGRVDSVSNAYAAFVARSSTSGTGQTVDALKATDSTASYFANAKYSANTHIWNYGGSTTEAMRIDTNGRLGIGTNSPNVLLEVNNTTAGSEVSRFEGNYSASGKVVLTNWRRNGGAIASAMRYNDATTMEFGTTTNHAQAFMTNSTECGRFDTSGGLRVGLTSNIFNSASSEKFSVKNTSTGCAATFQSTDVTGGYPVIYVSSSDTANATQNTILFYRGASSVGSITTTASATAYNTSSDYRLKENVSPMTGALNKILQLKPVTYTWKIDGSDGQGFIAHELQDVVPDCVTGNKDAVDADGKPIYQGIDTSFLVATLTAAIQELKADLDADRKSTRLNSSHT